MMVAARSNAVLPRDEHMQEGAIWSLAHALRRLKAQRIGTLAHVHGGTPLQQ